MHLRLHVSCINNAAFVMPGKASFGWLALDVGRQLLYYTDSGNGWIGVIDLNTGNQSSIYSDPASKPFAVAVDTVHRLTAVEN